MSRVLIYYTPNKSSNVIETIAKGFIDNGHQVFLLTQTPEGDIHEKMQKFGVEVYSYSIPKSNAVSFYFKNLFFLAKFCRNHQIDVVQSHLQQANIVAVFAQFLIKCKVIVFRHHLVEPNKMANKFDFIINKLAKTIVVPSKVIKQKLIIEDGVRESKVKLIPYVYDFSKYPIANQNIVDEIRKQYQCKLLILLCGRFVPLKRNEIAFYSLKKLIEEKYDVKLLALDEGPGMDELKNYVKANQLERHATFLGYKKNVMDYIAACDVFIHPSYTEASNNTVKEASLYSKNVIVCEGVGDFSDYIIHQKNGYLANKENPLEDMINCLKLIYVSKDRNTVGEALKNTVYGRFHNSKEIIQAHLNLLN